MIKVITFDCWDTLLDDDESRNKKRLYNLLAETFIVPAK